MPRLVVASNRTAPPGEARPGGLGVALRDALVEAGGGVWFGWSGDVLARETRGVRLVSDGPLDYALVDLTAAEYEGYYLGYANRTLWPVFHYRLDLALFEDAAFAGYEAVNRRFGRTLYPLLREGDVVWVHDYHLLLLGQELRNEGWQGPLGFFLHIPFPPPEIFAALPQHARVARALLDFDLLGFQTDRDVGNFRRYLETHHGAVAGEDEGQVLAFGRTCRIASFPIGIDADDIARLAVSDEAKTAAARVARVIGDRALVLGVDRMDYSKGLPQRMEAFGRLLDEHEDLRSRVNMLQIAPPSREAVDAYRVLRQDLDRLSGRINGDYSDLDWMPVRYLARSYGRDVLAGLYRLARVGLITPLHDGMNLVAKEFVAAQDPEDPGVLVLSEFAGAAERMGASLLVNPHDTGAVADAMLRAITMPLEERTARWRELDAEVRTHDVAAWRRDYLDALRAVAA